MSYDLPSLAYHFTQGSRRGDPRWRDDLTSDELQALWLVKQDDERILALQQLAQNVKNASLGKTPEQIAETLKVQVNLGIGGLLAIAQRDRAVFSAILLNKGVCTQLELDAAFAAPALDALNEVISDRLLYWHWINQVDAEVLACIADPERVPSFPAPPTLN